MRSVLVIHNQKLAQEGTFFPVSDSLSPERILRSNGYIVTCTCDQEQAKQLIIDADAAVLQLSMDEVKPWSTFLMQLKGLPLIWWCDERSASQSLEACEDDVMLDGMLTPFMKGYELHWALHFSSKQFVERQQWYNEREQLLSRIEERKWIDMAKSILCEIKSITESEAYDILRKQAMNERKRLVDVATSIVKVYQLLQVGKESRAKPK
ncbi:ANTAR domain-containing response regulator [Paenibacillus sp. FSL H8-0034]|uniref:ANTAR domain-containing response regulator n=1 Tax=Paenibacillus sp. FSL H8-0034 TaxID=2954671 RepID=UPI0030FB457D